MNEPKGVNPLRLFSGPLSMFGAKVHIALLEKGLDADVIMVPFDMKAYYEPKHPEVLRVNPKRQVPVLVHGALEIFDSTQIFEYLEDFKPAPALWPTSIDARARARLLEHKSDEIYFPHIIKLMGLQSTPDDPLAIASRAGAAEYYSAMESQLHGRDYLAGAYSFADIAFFMAQLFGERMGAPLTESTPALLQWRRRMVARPAVKQGVAPLKAFLIEHGRPVPKFMM